MPKYKTAKQLKITSGERKWLIETMKVLKTVKTDEVKPINGFDLQFDMNVVVKPIDGHFCGAAGCIKGWMGLLSFHAGKQHELDLGRNLKRGDLIGAVDDMENSPVLEGLFYPDGIDYDTVTSKVAAKAIGSFLTIGDPKFVKNGARKLRGY
jgi:hypothetical protein